MAAQTKKLNLEDDQRYDLDEQRFLIDSVDVRTDEAFRNFFTKEATSGYILKGFEFEEVSASLVIRLKDLESIAIDSAGHIIYRPVTGSTTDFSLSNTYTAGSPGLPAAGTTIYLHLYEKEVKTDLASRKFWDATASGGAGAEVTNSTNTRKLRTFGVYLTTDGFADSADPQDTDDPGTHQMIQVGTLTHDSSEVDFWKPTPTSTRVLVWESVHSENEVGNRTYFKPGNVEFSATVNGALGASSGTVPVNEDLSSFPQTGTLIVGHGVFDGTNDQEILEYTSHDGGSPGTFTLSGTTANAHANNDPVSVLSPAGWEFSINCSFDGTNWVKDVDDMVASRYRFDGEKLVGSHRDAANNTDWLDTAWDQDYVKIDAINLLSNPTAGTGATNELHAKNVVKAWANVTTDGIGGATINNGFNVTNATIAGTGVDIDFVDDLSSSQAVSLCNLESSGADYGHSGAPTVAGVTVFAHNSVGGAVVDLSTTAHDLSIFVIGEQ